MSRPIGFVSTDGTARAAAHLIAAAGMRVLLYQLDGGHRTRLSTNIEAAATPTDIGFDCDIVLTFIDDSIAFRDFLLGTPERTGLGAEMNPGAILVDFGVRPPRETQALLGVIGMRGVAILDAAFLGLQPSAHAAAQTIVLLGGFPDSVERAEPVLTHLGRIERTGPLGSAHTSAALMGYLEAAHHVVQDEALAVGRALGLPGDALQRLLDGKSEAPPAAAVTELAQRIGLALRLAQDRGISADIIDLTGARLAGALARRKTAQ